MTIRTVRDEAGISSTYCIVAKIQQGEKTAQLDQYAKEMSQLFQDEVELGGPNTSVEQICMTFVPTYPTRLYVNFTWIRNVRSESKLKGSKSRTKLYPPSDAEVSLDYQT